jgi:hypothetical protein
VDAWEALLAGKMAELVVARDFTTLTSIQFDQGRGITESVLFSERLP